MDLSDKEIEALVVKSQNGDKEAFAKIYDIYVTPIYQYIFYKVNPNEVEDLTEALFLKLWKNIGKYKKRKNITFKSWLFRIAHNLVVDHYRLYREHSSLELCIPDTKKEADPIKLAQDSLNINRLKSAISKLKPNYQQVLILKFINDLSNTEISKIVKKSEGSIRILQFRALKALKTELEHMGINTYE
ncbi:sigma-70 family RNA polymerase sigma factor [bacterium]|nr:sigma-70 family RNA polymerase sigma factor [bacterium]